MIGKTLSHYKVIEKIGQGGMGEVYRAEDTNLSREVAIKVLPEQFTQDPQRLARFEREAKLLASLNHPNIAAIYGFEEADDVRFLAMELVPGETLQERVAKGPLPVEEALEVCRQIAEGVEAAHEKGVIHRDLKPANVKVTPEGKVKILDFGLAKAFEEETPVTDISQSPTLTEEMTRAGVILGTAAYMSPEQAKGKPVDKRADVFAFGAMLYELLTGKRAFEGETITETIAKVLESEPKWEALPGTTPWTIQTLLRRCLQKDPKHRFHHVADVRIEIQAALSDPSEVLLPGSLPVRSLQIHWGLVVGLALLTFVLGAGAVLWSLEPAATTTEPTARFVIDLGPDHSIPVVLNSGATGSQGDSFAISPDGQHVVYVALSRDTEQSLLYLRSIDQFKARTLPDTEDASDPFFSPDSQWLGFLVGNELRKISLAGGSPVSLATMPGNTYGRLSWGKEMIVFGTVNTGLWKLPVNGGEPQPLTTLDTEKGEIRHGDVYFLPGGQTVLFTAQYPPSPSVWLLSLATGEQRELMAGTRPVYASSGHIVFQRSGALFALPFNVDRLQETSPPVPLTQKVRVQLTTGLAEFAISNTGSLVYLPPQENLGSSLVWVDRQGGSQVPPLLETQNMLEYPHLSSDSKQVAFESNVVGGRSDIWIFDVDRGTRMRLTTEGGGSFPVWTADGEKITFRSTRAEADGIYWKPADGSGAAELLLSQQSDNPVYPTSWAPDGQTLTFYEVKPGNDRDIWTLPVAGDASPFLATQFNERAAIFSPNGRWLAYVSDESGQDEVYVQPYPGPGGRWVISTNGGVEPLWSRDGGELFYRIGNQIMVVKIQTEPVLTAGTPQLLFEGQFPPNLAGNPNYDITPDGQRFVMVKEVGEDSSEINVILNWTEELKRLAPTDN